MEPGLKSGPEMRAGRRARDYGGPPAEGAVALLRADRIAPSPYQTRAEGAAR